MNLPPGLERRLDAIAAAEQCDTRALVLSALRALVQTYPGVPRRRRPRRLKVPIRQRFTVEDAGVRLCRRCEHPVDRHVEPDGCIEGRCICREVVL